MEFRVNPGGKVCGEARVPGDKSISHRSIMLGAIAEGETRVQGFLEGEDALATVAAFRAMGVRIDGPEAGKVTVHGVGLKGLQPPAEPIDLGNSGTSIRLMSGLLAGQDFDSRLTGDQSLCGRPMGRVITPLQQMGAQVGSAEGGRPPLAIKGGCQLTGIHYDLPMASAQVKSCVLLAGLYARGQTSVTEPAATRDHTERMLNGFGYPVQRDEQGVISLLGGGRLSACDIDVPADISSAAFLLVAASISPGSELLLRHVGINPTRTGVVNILRLMGADIAVLDAREVGGEPVADIRVRYSELKGIDIPEEQVPLAIDEFPALFIAAACARGRTVLRGAEELRVKESDRIAAMAAGLRALGIHVEESDDGALVHGGQFAGGDVESFGDHRIAMSLAVAGTVADGPVTVRDVAAVETSFPGFEACLSGIGAEIVCLQDDPA